MKIFERKAAVFMNVPVSVPFFAAAFVFCLAVAAGLRVSVTAFDLAAHSPPFSETASRFFTRLLIYHPWLQKLAGPPDVEEKLALAGNPYGFSPEAFDTLRFGLIGLAAASALLGVFSSNMLAFIPVVFIKLPDWWLSFLISERRKAMKREFIMVASRLATALSAGLELRAALEWASGGITEKRSALREELRRAVEEARYNAPLEEVLKNFAARTGLLDAQRLATTVIQAQRYGASVAGKLSEAVKDARERRKAEIVGQAKSAEQKLYLAVFVMALPTIICTLAPMLISLAQQNPFH
ncbi:type II secretion system F family protein [Moorella sp. E306M]|uniref:type II secretion system F family protein n=1 Tax=Moorella sp. E306M TaxID=2572683 RepID=UPI001141E5E7|nr:type II secretion system F family protein [Moorella sp. E306M]